MAAFSIAWNIKGQMQMLYSRALIFAKIPGIFNFFHIFILAISFRGYTFP